MPELRYNPLIDTWVIIASERSKRPSDFPAKEEKKDTGTCPFCPGNEHMTPPETLSLRENDGENAGSWLIRAFPNKFAALKSNGESSRIEMEGIYEKMPGVGVHEVIVETPDHNRHLKDETEDHIFKILKAWQQRYSELKKDSRIKYTQLFKNHGAAAGASLVHPHSQLIATPFVPVNIAEEIENLNDVINR